MNKKKLKQDKIRLARLAEDSISMEFFLTRYLGIRDKNVISGEITHKNIKAIFPNIVRPSFEYTLDNPNMVGDGEILLVEDFHHSVVPYFNPNFIYEDTDYYGEFIKGKPTEEIPNINDMDITELSNYELQKLLHIYEEHNMRGAYRRVHDELTSRKDSRRASHESIERTLRKERKRKKFEE